MALIRDQAELFGTMFKGLSGSARMTTYGTDGGILLDRADFTALSANVFANSSAAWFDGPSITLTENKTYMIIGFASIAANTSTNNFITSSVRDEANTVLASHGLTHWISSQTGRTRQHTMIFPYTVTDAPATLTMKINSTQNAWMFASNTSDFSAANPTFLAALDLTVPTNLLDNA